jgi:hypothetical protein
MAARLSAGRTLPPGFFIFKDSWYSFLLEAESTPGPYSILPNVQAILVGQHEGRWEAAARCADRISRVALASVGPPPDSIQKFIPRYKCLSSDGD